MFTSCSCSLRCFVKLRWVCESFRDTPAQTLYHHLSLQNTPEGSDFSLAAAPSLVDVIAPVAEVEVPDHEKGRGKGQRKGKGKGKLTDVLDPNNPADPPKENPEQ